MMLLIEDLRIEDRKKRILSLQALKDIAGALGPVRTREQLVQFLFQFLDDEEEIVL